MKKTKKTTTNIGNAEGKKTRNTTRMHHDTKMKTTMNNTPYS